MTKKPFDDSNINNNPYRLHFDPQDYVRYLDGMDLTDTDAEALLATLWDIMVQFVDLGFQVDVGLDEPPSLDDMKPRGANKKQAAFKKGDGP